jgi:hypothetical protein
MNFVSNIWNQPKTSAAGLLIATVTIAGALSRQGVTLGTAGTGTVVMLASGIATALLGLLAQDPLGAGSTELASSRGTTARLGAWALIALLVQLTFVSGCSGTTVAQDIVNWTPTLQSAVAAVNSTATLLAPADAPIFAATTVGFDAASNLLVGQAKAYLANPSASILAVADPGCRLSATGELGTAAGGKDYEPCKPATCRVSHPGGFHHCECDALADSICEQQSGGGEDGCRFHSEDSGCEALCG